MSGGTIMGIEYIFAHNTFSEVDESNIRTGMQDALRNKVKKQNSHAALVLHRMHINAVNNIYV